MQSHQRTNGLALITLSVLAILGWMRTLPASAQQDTSPAFRQDQAPRPQPGQPPTYLPIRSMGPTALAAGGSYVYVLRGNTLYQMRAGDLALVNRKELPSYSPSGREP